MFVTRYKPDLGNTIMEKDFYGDYVTFEAYQKMESAYLQIKNKYEDIQYEYKKLEDRYYDVIEKCGDIWRGSA